jgi:hypothetical protein
MQPRRNADADVLLVMLLLQSGSDVCQNPHHKTYKTFYKINQDHNNSKNNNGTNNARNSYHYEMIYLIMETANQIFPHFFEIIF